MSSRNTARDAAIRAVIFDWAGTIIDFGCFGPVVAFQEVFSRARVPITMEEARRPMGLPKKDHLRSIAAMPAVGERWEARHGKSFTDGDIEELYAAFTGMQIAVLKEHCGLVPGAGEVVETLRARRVRIGSTTGYVRAMMQEVIPRVQAQGLRVESTVCADDVVAGRPHPWMAFRVMEELDVYPPHVCLKIGDTLPDIAEGRNSGMWTVAVVHSSSDMGLTEGELNALGDEERQSRSAAIAERFRAAGAHYTIDTVRDLPRLMTDIEEQMRKGVKP